MGVGPEPTVVPQMPVPPHPPVRAGAVAHPTDVLTGEQVVEVLAAGLAGRVSGDRVLLVVPDHTRSVPLPGLFRALVELLTDAVTLDVLVALGTHPPLAAHQLDRLVDRGGAGSVAAGVELVNHDWRGAELMQVGTLSPADLRRIAGEHWHPTLDDAVPVRVNRRVTEYDHVVIVGPTFPHEVAGFSGGAKYLFPGLSGPEMIDVSHWLGALCGVLDTIGVADTPVRAMIQQAAAMVEAEITLVSLVVVDDGPSAAGGGAGEPLGGLAGVFVGDLVGAWRAAVEVSAERHVIRVPAPFTRILSWAPPMYDELWTAAKAAYKLEPVLAPGGELIVYAPHLEEISAVHGDAIRAVGYHVLDYFLEQWDRFADVPLAVLAHSSHVRGAGTFEGGVEHPRASVSLASRIPAEVCAQLGLGYVDPATVEPGAWRDREDEGVLFVPRAGETLYRLGP